MIFTKLTSLDVKSIVEFVEDITLNYDHMTDNAQTALYEYFMEQMPYGTAKARTGDPDVWITDRMSTWDAEQVNDTFKATLCLVKKQKM